MPDPSFSTLISADQLAARLKRPDLRIIDCRYDLTDPDAGRRIYLESHLPGALYADLGKDLSGPPLTDRGRHPLPSPDAMTALFSALGVSPGTQVVAYDQTDGAIAARLWWMLRYMGHETAAVLDGGFTAWREADLPVESGDVARTPARFTGAPRGDWLVTLDRVPGVPCLVDARLAPRYRGETEPLDPVAGHIPGAKNLPYRGNVGEDGRFLSPAQVAARFAEVLGDRPPEDAVYYCGSGVTACHLLLAAAHAGLPPGKLYAGSWSEWCRDPARPVATGPEPGPPLEG
ncbi:MAG: sulfurtransferase [Gammaproteobacteria bacterium]|nr:sulfurtransferase [Gammaproteobacteria bacterium]